MKSTLSRKPMVVVNDVELHEPDETLRLPAYQQHPSRFSTFGHLDAAQDAAHNVLDCSQLEAIMPADPRLVRPADYAPLQSGDFVFPISSRRSLHHPQQHHLNHEPEDEFTWLNAVFAVLAIVSYLFKCTWDSWTCYELFLEGNHWWFGLTAAILITPAVTVNAFSLRWYMHDQHETKANPESFRRPRYTACGWVLRGLLHLLLLGPVVRYVDLLCFGFRSRVARRQQQRRQREWHLSFHQTTSLRVYPSPQDDVDYYLLMIHEDRDTAMLELLKSFMGAPQLLLQLFILASRINKPPDPYTEYWQIGTSVSSLFQLSWALAAYHRALRRSVTDKRNMTRMGTALQFLWRFCTIGSRVLALGLFAAEYKYWIFPLCIGHWGVMTIWVMHQGTSFCDTEAGGARPCEEYLFNMVIGAIYLFCFLNVKDEPTRYKYVAYYIITFIENASLIILWFLRASPSLWYHLPALVAVFGAFFLGIIFMVIYYCFFHPNGRLPLINPAARCC